ncbi:DHHC palmitoyltransferase-domain-containing protein [Cunninghamella echinulata]|nr:DHHC palmitoyltransferase-domain-containing protein [Cunninghamella echinulata]
MSFLIEKILIPCFFPIFVIGSLTTSLYAYYNQFCAPLLANSNTVHRGGIDILFTTLVWFLSVYSYLKIILTPLKKPIQNDQVSYWYSPGLESQYYLQQENLSQGIPVGSISMCQSDGNSNYCQVCQIIKPDRCHHCRICDTCVLKMDHHCIWINGCVGFSNYKIFVLFLSYTTMFILWLLYNYLNFIVNNIQMETSFIGLLWVLYKTYVNCIITILSNLCNSIWTRSLISPFINLPSLVNIK